jgi:hypothetical protein
MDYRTAHIRRLRAGTRLNKRLAGVAMLGIAACASVCVAALLSPGQPAADSPAVAVRRAAAPAGPVVQATLAVTAPAKAMRRVYPFSIVPGGVTGRADLVRVLKTDRVVAEHYAGFEVARASPVTVKKARAVYVSYRKGDKVYWTANKVMLAEGETLLSDGNSAIRTRCGNRISDLPQLPVAPGEPSPQLLDTAIEVADEAADDAADGQGAQVLAASADGVAGAEAGGHAFALTTFANGAGLLPAGARASTTLAMLGMPAGEGVRTGQSRGIDRLVALPAFLPSVQPAPDKGPNDTAATPVPPSDTVGSTTSPVMTAGTIGAGIGGIIGGNVGIIGGTAPVTAPATDSAGNAPAATPAPAPGTPPDAGRKPAPELPTLPDALSPDSGLPVAVAEPPSRSSELPEPDGLSLSASALAVLLLLRRKRPPARG